MTSRDADTDAVDATTERAKARKWTPDSASDDAQPAEEVDATPEQDGSTEQDATPDPDGSAEKDGSADKVGKPARGRRHRHAAGDADDAEKPTDRSAPRRRRWALVAAVVVAALFAGAMVALWAATRPDPIAGLSGSQQSAVDAATQAAVNLQTFRRASFDQDFANALASLTPEYGKEQFAPRKDELKKQLTDGARDATATVQSAGLVSASATQAVVLVVTNTVQTADDGTSTPFVFARLQLTMQLTDGKWLVSDLKSVGLS